MKKKQNIITHGARARKGNSHGLWFIISLIFISPVFANQNETSSEPEPFYLMIRKPAEMNKGFKHESEHAAKPVRKYWLSTVEKDLNLEGYLMVPEGAEKELNIENNKDGYMISFNSPWGDGEQHGANNAYVVDKKVVNNTLYIRTAKWLAIHHSCGWGHGRKHEEKRHTALAFEKVPFEIVPQVLWDDKFHVRTKTGDTIKVYAYAYGKPVENAQITITTEHQWKKTMVADEKGGVQFQIIRDYYPKDWARFHRIHRSFMLFEAEYEVRQKGEYKGLSYDRIKMITTLPWKYSPALDDYASYKYGLIVGMLFFILTIGGVVFYRERRRKPFLELDFEKKVKEKQIREHIKNEKN